MKESMGEKEIDELFTRGVGEFIDPEGTFRKKLEAKLAGKYNKDIIIKLGADPTRPDLHIGHAVVLHRLRKFQDLGCKVVFIVGDFTSFFGDPTGRNTARPKTAFQKDINNTSPSNVSIEPPKEAKEEHKTTYVPEIPTSEEISRNMATYIEQLEKTKILDTSREKFSWIKNSDWFLNTTDMVYGSDAKATINLNFKENEKEKQLSVDLNPNSLLGKTILFEKTRMQTKIKPEEVTLITLRGLLWTLQHITHSKLIDRDMFQERIKNNEELFMHEMLYPVIQGIDSYSLARIYGSCDLEVGGTDQKFNMLMGRDVMKINNIEPQSVLTFNVLEGLDGKEKMSKSLDNYIGITDEPNDMYGKTMSIPDSSIGNYFELATFTPMDEVEKIRKGILDNSIHPKEAKMNLARQIVAIYHGEKKAKEAEENFINIFQKGEIPADLEEIKGEGNLGSLMVSKGVLPSMTEWRRLIDEGAIKKLNGKNEEKITDFKILASPGVYKIGKRRFIKII